MIVVSVAGTAGAQFEPVRVMMADSLARGDDVGLSICAIRDGETIIDLWGGTADVETGAGWERDTVINVFSTTKTMVALCALMLVDAGELDVDAPVARYWPEFAQAGKDRIPVRALLGHTSGLAGWEQPMQLDDLYDVEQACALLAAQPPWWTSGEGSGYHAMTYGHLVDGVVRRITGLSLGAFFAERVAGPAQADFWIGTPATVDERIARLIPPAAAGSVDWRAIPAQSVVRRALLNPVLDIRRVAGRDWRAAELAAMNGHGNARSVARIQSVISHGGSADTGITLRHKTINRIFDIQSDGVDRVLGFRLRFGIGYGLAAHIPDIPDGRVCWWSGYGGSVVVNDLDRRLTVAYVMNKMDASLVSLGRAGRYLRAIYAALN